MIYTIIILCGIIPLSFGALWLLMWAARFVNQWFELFLFHTLERGVWYALWWGLLESWSEVPAVLLLRFQGKRNDEIIGERWTYKHPFKYTKKGTEDDEK